ncbi:pilus assembly protein TadG-related protein [Desertihabitans brevis]|nr:pilus assembly protein TadG-related protein [Desertihabitans brevis]
MTPHPGRDERGAVKVMFALLVVPLLGFAAISLDIAAMWHAKQQLQSGADAAALAIAQDCARGGCGNAPSTAGTLADANLLTSDADAAVLNLTSSSVTVRTSTMQRHVFAPLLGFDEDDVVAHATAAWGAPSGGTTVLPLAFSLCEWDAQTGGGQPSGTTQYTIYQTKSSGTDCTGPSGNLVPGGFGWVDSDPGRCGATSTIGQRLSSDPGNNVPSGCGDVLRSLVDETVLLPLFDQYGGNGTNAWYRVHGYAAFTLTGYHLSGHDVGTPCGGSERCIQGYFTRYVDLDDDFDSSPSAPRLGASLVRLTD